MKFGRNVVNPPAKYQDEDKKSAINKNLYLFCDASPQAYEFSAYGEQNKISQIIFSNVKIAPMKPKTLPMMGLLEVHSAIKSLASLLKAYSKMISTCVIGQEPLSATNQSTKTYDVRFCFGVKIQTQEKHFPLTYAVDHPSRC